MDQLYHSFPLLHGTEKSGKTKIWLAQVFANKNNTACAVIIYGQEDGKLQETRREYTTGKNIGKKNETTPLMQCMSETERKWLDKLTKEGYVDRSSTVSNTQEEKMNTYPVYPMLAQTYDPKAKNKKKGIKYPCFVQPKIDGLRCLMYSATNIVCQSRTGGQFQTVGHLVDILGPLLTAHPDWVIDGELYTRNYPFEELAGLIKKVKLSDTDLDKLRWVEYHIYDAICLSAPELPFEDRLAWLHSHLPNHPLIVSVQTDVVNDIPEFLEKFSLHVSDGWEGVMLRNCDGPYLVNYRSHDLQKYKEMMEEEYSIVGWKEADGRDKGTVIWLCRTTEGLEFAVRPRGTLEQRREWFEQAEKYLGKQLTVIFQEKSEKNVPRFPVGKAIRDGY